MKPVCILFAVISVACGAVVDYGAPASSGYSAPAAGGYGGQAADFKVETKCTPYFDTVNTEHCEAYTDRVCLTTHKESCQDVPYKTCRGVVSAKQTRKCFNVTEERCSLKEDVKFETIQVPFVVQKCHKVNERVCDTVYEAQATESERQQCINVEDIKCDSEDKIIYDVTCRTTTKFDCQTTGEDYNQGYEQQQQGYGNDAYGRNDGYGQESYGKQEYSAPKSYCKRSQEKKCYKTPRTVSVQKCAPTTERVCESVRLSEPHAQPRLSCRNEEKKVCELEERNQAKQVKRYVYEKVCRPVPRNVCDNADSKSLVPSCVGATRKQCSYSPVEQCSEEPKKHCYTVQHKVKKEKCETFKKATGGAADYQQQQQYEASSYDAAPSGY